MRPLSAEFVKLRRPLTLAVTVFVVILAAMALLQQQSQGRQALAEFRANSAVAAALGSGTIGFTDASGQTVTCSRQPGVSQSTACAQYLASLTQVQNGDIQKLIDTEDAASLEQNPAGVGTQVGGLLASLLGFFAVMLLAAGHVGGEWSGKTIRAVLTRQPNRFKVLVTKMLSVWLGSVALLGVVWVVLAAQAIYFHITSPLNPVGPGLPATDGLIALAKTLVVLAAYSAVATCLAVLFRGIIGATVAGLAFGIGSLMSGYYFPWASHHEFVYWVTGYMAFDSVPMIGTGTYWLTTFWGTVQRPTFDGGLAGLVLLFALAISITALAFRRTDLTV